MSAYRPSASSAAPDSDDKPQLGAPAFAHHEAVSEAFDSLFRVFQLPDPVLRRALSASLLVENALVLLSGTYGTGKTQFVHLLRKLFFSEGDATPLYDYETCHQDLTAFDVLYHLDLAELQRGREVVHPKDFIAARLKFLNEIQRASTTFFNALLPFFAERRVTYRDVEFDVPDFLCIMDRNPQDAGSSEIPEAFMDRIDFSFDIPALHLEDTLKLQAIRHGPNGIDWGGLDRRVSSALPFEDLVAVWEDVKRVDLPHRTLVLGAMLTDALRLCIVTERSTARIDFDLECDRCQFYGEICSHLLKVPGQRVTNSLYRLAQALAWLDREPAARAEHLLAALPWALAHRLALRPEHLREKPSPQSWVQETAVDAILRPKLPRWQEALDAHERGDTNRLEELGANDLAVRSLALAENRPISPR